MELLLYIATLMCFLPSSLGFTSTDNHKLNQLSSDYAISPNKDFVISSVKQWDQSTGKTLCFLQKTDLYSNETTRLTNPALGQKDFSPVMSALFPFQLFFLSNRSGSVQIWTIALKPDLLDMIRPYQLSFYPVDVDNLQISKLGGVLAFTALVYPDCEDLKCTALRDAQIAERGTNTWAVYDQLFVRHWDEWLTEKVSHVFIQYVIEQSSDFTLKGEVKDAMKGLNTNTPVPPFGGKEQFDINEKGTKLLVTAQNRDREEAWRTNWKILLIDLENNTVENIFKWNRLSRAQNPKFSPNQNQFGYLGMHNDNTESDLLSVEIYNSNQKDFTFLTSFTDKEVLEFLFLSDDVILFNCVEEGQNVLYTISVKDQLNYNLFFKSETLLSPTNIQQLTYNSFIFAGHSFTNPMDLYILKNNSIQQITYSNKDLPAMSEPISFWFPSGKYDEEVQGFVFKPIPFEENKKYPLAFIIHGGPESSFESGWSYRWNPQLWANQGYAVAMINPHGSQGYGQRFKEGVINDWGGLPYEDLMQGYLNLRRFDWIDITQSCALGASYGGYMVNWIQGMTDRFKCLVTHDGVFSTLGMFYMTEELWFPMVEYCPKGHEGCKPWDPNFRDGYLKWSPEKNVDKFKTPHLIIHGSNDYRIPESEGLSMFTALQVKGVPSRFLRFTQENHWVLKPENSIKWQEEIFNWMQTWINHKEEIEA